MKKIWIPSLFLFLAGLLALSAFSLTDKDQGHNNLTKVVPKKVVLEKKEDKKVVVMLLGDIMLGRSVNMRSLDMGNVNYPFEKVADKLRSADIVFANLETPIIENCPRIEHGFTFCADPKMIGGLLFSGVDIVNLANNHTKNFGEKGLKETENLLTQKGVAWVGNDNLEIIEKDGVKFGFLGFDLFDNELSENYLNLIRDSDKKTDVLIVGVHWGDEYHDKANSQQRQWARKIIDSGADVISGHHPHWVEDSEYINGKPVYYSLGNFIFDQMWSEETKKGLSVILTFKKSQLVKTEEVKSYMSEWAQPEWVLVNQ